MLRNKNINKKHKQLVQQHITQIESKYFIKWLDVISFLNRRYTEERRINNCLYEAQEIIPAKLSEYSSTSWSSKPRWFKNNSDVTWAQVFYDDKWRITSFRSSLCRPGRIRSNSSETKVRFWGRVYGRVGRRRDKPFEW